MLHLTTTWTHANSLKVGSHRHNALTFPSDSNERRISTGRATNSRQAFYPAHLSPNFYRARKAFPLLTRAVPSHYHRSWISSTRNAVSLCAHTFDFHEISHSFQPSHTHSLIQPNWTPRECFHACFSTFHAKISLVSLPLRLLWDCGNVLFPGNPPRRKSQRGENSIVQIPIKLSHEHNFCACFVCEH